jgi:hypothetical protein
LSRSQVKFEWLVRADFLRAQRMKSPQFDACFWMKGAHLKFPKIVVAQKLDLATFAHSFAGGLA